MRTSKRSKLEIPVYTFTGWDSDRGEGYFKPTPPERVVVISNEQSATTDESQRASSGPNVALRAALQKEERGQFLLLL
jgi:hypothetical protein